MKICDCGAEIEFGIGPKGNRIPLVPIGHVYQLVGDQAVPMKGLFRNHFLDCPKAAEFRSRGRAVAESGPPPDNAQLVHDLLSLVLEDPPMIETIHAWSPEQRSLAAEWAARLHTIAADGSGTIPKPAFLEAWR